MADWFLTESGPCDHFRVQSSRGGLAEFSATLLATGAAEFPLQVSKAPADERIRVSSVLDVPGDVQRLAAETPEAGKALGDLVAGIQDSRMGSLSCATRMSGPKPAVEIEVLIYQDGFSRHSVNTAVLEIAKVRRQLAAAFQFVVESARAAAEMKKATEECERRLAEMEAEFQRKYEAARPPMDPAVAPVLPAAPATPAHAELPRPSCPNPQCRQPVVPGTRFCTACGTRIV